MSAEGRHGHVAHKFRLERVARLDAEERLALQPWAAALDALDLASVRRVLDLGCGTGYFAIPLARALAGRGAVVALDVEPEMLRLLRTRAAEAGVGNVHLVQTGEPGLPIRTAAVDLVVLVNMLHEFEDLEASLTEVVRVMRPGSTVFLSDWRKRPTEEGPPVEARIAEEDAIRLLVGAGFTAVRPAPLYRDHYAMIAARE